ncbi:MAG: DUF433 domain-containing protein [Leptolyngbya sp. Prado105]|jgi:uncharacterized protein (DUF433 family)|nr:DUF433 domain-containing protein [Leptolyngbya sp. Prado105]
MCEQGLLARIIANPRILDGKPIIRDRPLSVEQVLGELASGETIETLLDRYSWLEKEDIQACFLYAQKLVQEQKPVRSIEDFIALMPEILKQAPYIRLLILFGSRARGNATQKSDWDFAFLCDEEQRKHYEKGGWDTVRIWGILQTIYRLGDDQIDVVDLEKTSEFLVHSIARDGQIIYEYEPGAFERFKQQKLLSPDQIKQKRKQLRSEIDRKLRELQS